MEKKKERNPQVIMNLNGLDLEIQNITGWRA